MCIRDRSLIVAEVRPVAVDLADRRVAEVFLEDDRAFRVVARLVGSFGFARSHAIEAIDVFSAADGELPSTAEAAENADDVTRSDGKLRCSESGIVARADRDGVAVLVLSLIHI